MLSDQFDDLRRLDVFSKLLYDSWLKGLRTLDIYLSKLCDSTWSKMHYNLKRKNIRNNVTNYLNYYIKQCAYNDHLNLPCYYLSVIIFETPFSVSLMCSWSKRRTFWKNVCRTEKKSSNFCKMSSTRSSRYFQPKTETRLRYFVAEQASTLRLVIRHQGWQDFDMGWHDKTLRIRH